MPKAKKILGAFEIGKKDARYENGLATREELIEIAEALNITILISDNLTKWKKTNKEYGADNESLGWHRSMTSDRSTIHLRDFGRSDLGFLTTFAHEIAHAIEKRALNHRSSKTYRTYKKLNAHNKSSKTVKQDFYPTSFRELLNELIRDSKNKHVIKKEIDRLQDEIDFFVARRPELGMRDVRSSGMHQFLKDLEKYGHNISQFTPAEIAKNVAQSSAEQGGYRTYKKNAAEFAVDPLWVYLLNPKLMKSELPETSKLIQQFFNQPKSDFPVTFHANPMATILAIVLAGLAIKKGEEEEEQRPIQPLQQGQGILSV
jgi:hypothetical protein